MAFWKKTDINFLFFFFRKLPASKITIVFILPTWLLLARRSFGWSHALGHIAVLFVSHCGASVTLLPRKDGAFKRTLRLGQLAGSLLNVSSRPFRHNVQMLRETDLLVGWLVNWLVSWLVGYVSSMKVNLCSPCEIQCCSFGYCICGGCTCYYFCEGRKESRRPAPRPIT